MTWFDSSSNELESVKPHALMAVAVSMQFKTTPINVWTGVGDLTIGTTGGSDSLNLWSAMNQTLPWRGGTYIPDANPTQSQGELYASVGLFAGEATASTQTTFSGIGTLGRISTPLEKMALVSEKRTYQLTGTDPTLASDADIASSFGRDVTERVLFLDPESRQVVDEPEISWEGRIDSISRKDGPEPVIEVNAEHRLAWLERSDGWLRTNEHQQQFFPGDLGYSLTPGEEGKRLIWGGKNANANRFLRKVAGLK